MSDQDTSATTDTTSSSSPRQRAIEAYESARGRATDTLGEAPLLALAGGIAAGAIIAALLPRTQTEARLIRPTARRVKESARAALSAARDTGTQRLDELGINRSKGEETARSLIDGLREAARASATAAIDAVRNQG